MKTEAELNEFKAEERRDYERRHDAFLKAVVEFVNLEGKARNLDEAQTLAAVTELAGRATSAMAANEMQVWSMVSIYVHYAFRKHPSHNRMGELILNVLKKEIGHEN